MMTTREPLLRSDDEEELVFDQTGLLSKKVSVGRGRGLANASGGGGRLTIARTVNLCLSFFGLGLCFAIPTATFQDLRRMTKSTDNDSVEHIYTARYGGYIFGSLIGGLLFDCYNRQFLLFLSLLATAVGIIVMPFCTELATLMVCTAVTGITMGFLDTGGNVWCLDLWGRRSSPFMQALHFCFGLGALVAPLVAEPFLSTSVTTTQALGNMSTSIGSVGLRGPHGYHQVYSGNRFSRSIDYLDYTKISPHSWPEFVKMPSYSKEFHSREKREVSKNDTSTSFMSSTVSSRIQPVAGNESEILLNNNTAAISTLTPPSQNIVSANANSTSNKSLGLSTSTPSTSSNNTQALNVTTSILNTTVSSTLNTTATIATTPIPPPPPKVTKPQFAEGEKQKSIWDRNKKPPPPQLPVTTKAPVKSTAPAPTNATTASVSINATTPLVSANATRASVLNASFITSLPSNPTSVLTGSTTNSVINSTTLDPPSITMSKAFSVTKSSFETVTEATTYKINVSESHEPDKKGEVTSTTDDTSTTTMTSQSDENARIHNEEGISMAGIKLEKDNGDLTPTHQVTTENLIKSSPADPLGFSLLDSNSHLPKKVNLTTSHKNSLMDKENEISEGSSDIGNKFSGRMGKNSLMEEKNEIPEGSSDISNKSFGRKGQNSLDADLSNEDYSKNLSGTPSLTFPVTVTSPNVLKSATSNPEASTDSKLSSSTMNEETPEVFEMYGDDKDNIQDIYNNAFNIQKFHKNTIEEAIFTASTTESSMKSSSPDAISVPSTTSSTTESHMKSSSADTISVPSTTSTATSVSPEVSVQMHGSGYGRQPTLRKTNEFDEGSQLEISTSSEDLLDQNGTLVKNETQNNFSLFAKITRNQLGKFEFAYFILGIYVFVVALVFLVFLCLNPRESRSRQDEDLDKLHNVTLSFKIYLVGLMALFFFLYMGMEVAVGELLQTFVSRQSPRFSIPNGYFLTYIFWGGFAMARGISIFLSVKMTCRTMLIGDLGLCLIASVLLVAGADKMESLLWAGIGILGLGMASILPTSLIWLERHMHVTNKITAVLILSAAAGEMVIPILVNQFIEKEPMVLMYVNVSVITLCCVNFGALWLLTSKQGEKYSAKPNAFMYQLANSEDAEDEAEQPSSNHFWENNYNTSVLFRKKANGYKSATMVPS